MIKDNNIIKDVKILEEEFSNFEEKVENAVQLEEMIKDIMKRQNIRKLEIEGMLIELDEEK